MVSNEQRNASRRELSGSCLFIGKQIRWHNVTAVTLRLSLRVVSPPILVHFGAPILAIIDETIPVYIHLVQYHTDYGFQFVVGVNVFGFRWLFRVTPVVYGSDVPFQNRAKTGHGTSTIQCLYVQALCLDASSCHLVWLAIMEVAIKQMSMVLPFWQMFIVCNEIYILFSFFFFRFKNHLFYKNRVWILIVSLIRTCFVRFGYSVPVEQKKRNNRHSKWDFCLTISRERSSWH